MKLLASKVTRKAQKLFSKFSKNSRRLRKLRSVHAGQRIFVVGNGPSLNKIDLNLLRNEVTIASNGIFLAFEKTTFRPTYYTIEDTLVAEDRCTEAAKITGSTKIFPRDLVKWLKPDPHTLYIDFVRNYKSFPTNTAPQTKTSNYRPKFSTNISRNAFWGGTVTYMNLQIAYYLGANEVYLIGFDHDYARPAQTDKIHGTVITSSTPDRNHFDATYFGPGYRWHDPNVARMELSYVAAKEHFLAAGRSIYNASVGGKLEVFPRVSFESLF